MATLLIAGVRPETPDNRDEIPDGYAELVEQCWHGVPSHRPSFASIVVQLKTIAERANKPASSDGGASDMAGTKPKHIYEDAF